MTTDAKIGLLLGLVFIFAIAFIINGLPDFSKKQGTNEPTKDYVVELRGRSPGLAQKAREVAEQINGRMPDKQALRVERSATDEASIRDQRPLPPAIPTVANQQSEIKPPVLVPVKDATRTNKAHSASRAAFSRPEFHIVQEGDNISVIAKRFYGPEEGNRKANIDRIFRANRKILESPDKIFVGQKLVIPPLRSSAQGDKKVASYLDKKLFEKVRGIARKPLSLVSGGAAGRYQKYVVKQGDSLWQIAAERLGNGTRYPEIARLNADILDDEDELAIGTRLKLPGE